MNPTTQPQQTQDPTKGANQAKANLGFINTMQEHLLEHKANKNKPQQGQQNPQAEEKTEPKDNPTEEKKDQPNIAEELTKFKTEIEGLMDSKLGDLKREIEKALTEEDAKETETTKTA